MKKIVTAALALVIVTGLHAQVVQRQPVYNQRALEFIGLDQEQIRQVLGIQEEATASIQRYRADREIKKAELARLLLDEEPNLRLVERNLRETADIDVEIRMIEIRRELEIRRIIGTENWARVLQALRERSAQTTNELTEAAGRQLRELQQVIVEKQREIAELMQSDRSGAGDEEIRRKFQELQSEFQELQQLIRERLQ